MIDDFDLDNYPEKTDEVLVALHPDNIRFDNWISLKQIADRTSLSKDQVRYRIDKLVEDDFVGHLDVGDGHHPVEYFLFDTPKPNVERIMMTRELLGDVPETPSKKDLMRLVEHIQQLDTKIENLRTDFEALENEVRS